MRRLILLSAVLLAGCPGQPVQPLPTIREVPVPVACVKQIPEPPLLTHDSLGPEYPLDILYGQALKDKTALELYAGKLAIQVKACAVIPN